MKRISALLFFGLIAVLLAGAFFVLSWMQRPLGPALALNLPAQSAAQNPAKAAAPQAVAPQSVAKAPYSQQKTCGNSGTMSVLVMGLSNPEYRQVHGVSSIRLVKVDFDQKDVTILSLHPEMWAETPALSKEGITGASLTQVYMFAKRAAQGEAQVRDFKATQLFAQTLLDDFDYAPDHYVTLDQVPYAEMIDDLGGIDINIPAAVDGSAEGYGSFDAGQQHLDGQRTLDYVRILAAGQPQPNEWGRFARQNNALQAILATLLKPENWTKLPGFLQEYRKAAVTDLSLDQSRDLLCMLKEAGDQVTLLEVTPQMLAVDADGHLVPDMEAFQALLAQVKTN